MKKYHQSNIKFYNVAFLCFAFLILFVSSARAATIENTELENTKVFSAFTRERKQVSFPLIQLENKKIKIIGVCNGDVLSVQIFSATSSQPFYTAGADCWENKFEFKDDLGYWKIPDGDYSVAIIGKDDNFVNSSTAMFTIQSAALPVSGENIVEPTINLENNSVGGQENTAAKTEIINQEEAPDGLFAQVINFLVEWFKSAIVMIKELIAEKVSTPELCLGETCIVEDQLKDLLGGPLTPASIINATTTVSDVTTTTN